MQTAVEGHTETAKFLLEKGAKIDLIDKEKDATLLILAAYGGSLELVKLLLKRGMNKNVKDKDGKTARMHAEEQRHLNIMNFLDKN